MNRRTQNILTFVDQLKKDDVYSSRQLLIIIQGIFGFREKTGIAYIEDIKRMKLLKVGGDTVWMRDEEEIKKFKRRTHG